MSFTFGVDDVMAPLHLAMGVVDQRHTLPILTHLALEVSGDSLTITGSDQDMELRVTCLVQSEEEDDLEFTVPGRKFYDICRNLPAGSTLKMEPFGLTARIESGRFKSQLASLPIHDFPRVVLPDTDFEISIPALVFRRVLEQVAFAMAQQDVRYFFNGMLIDFANDKLRTVATNGQRLALSEIETGASGGQIIVPRKAIAEILKLAKGEEEVLLQVSESHLLVKQGPRHLSTKLIDAVYPDYERALPKRREVSAVVNRLEMRSALNRMSILSNELYRNVKLTLEPGLMRLSANNPMQEEAEELIQIEYEGDQIEIGFNVNYLTDVLTVLACDEVEICFTDPASPILLLNPTDTAARYVISPMVI